MSLDAALKRIRTRLSHRVEARALRAQDIAIQLHETAPRGGVNYNYYGDPRSAPGEQPAIEYGTLLTAMRDEYQYDPSTLTASFVANRLHLEYGTRHIDPRPMGRMTIDQLKQEVKR